MFDKFVADLLTTYLGEYFDNIDREQVKISVWNGKVHLRNLKMRLDALRFFDVPICVLMGSIDELTVIIPWTHLRSESVVVQIRNARLILSDKDTALYDLDQAKREERARKDRELKAEDDALLTVFRDTQRATQPNPAGVSSLADANAESSDNNFTARLKASILNNIRVEVEQLCVHYASSVRRATHRQDKNDDTTAISKATESVDVSSLGSHDMASSLAKKDVHPASLSFQIKGMKTYGCNERFEPAFVAPGERMCRQLIAFRGLAVSLRTGAAKETEIPLLQPFNVSFELAYQPVVMDLTVPQYMLALHMNESCVCTMTSESCTTCCELLRYLQCVRERQKLRQLRPVGDRPATKPKLWWRYVIDAVRQQIRHRKSTSLASAHKPTPFSWLAYTTTKAKRDRYMSLYLRRQRDALGATRWLEPLDVNERVEMVALEEELSIEMLKLAKRLALARVTVERCEYARLLSQKKASAAPSSSSAPSPLTKSPSSTTEAAAAVEDAQAPGSAGGWFSFWRSAPQPGTNSGNDGINAKGTSDDGVDDKTRAELRELVQLMTAEKWTEAQRAVIAQEFGMSAEEAKELALPSAASSFSSSPAAVHGADSLNISESNGNTTQALRAAPAWVVFVRAVSVCLELRSCKAEAHALHKPTSSTTSPTHDTLAKFLLGKLQGGAECGGGTAETSLPLAYYWGCVELFSITAAKLNEKTQEQQGEQEIVTLRQPQAAHVTVSPADALQSVSLLQARRPTGDVTPQQHTRPFYPLEACWSILSDECRCSAAWQFEWTHRSPPQLTSRASALHRVRVRLAPLHLVVDVVPLRRLADFFFTVMWPNASPAASTTFSDLAHSDLNDASVSTNNAASPSSTSSAPANFLTALSMPIAQPLTSIQERCAVDAEARLIILRRKVERQNSIEWDVVVERVAMSVAEIPNVQGCEVVMKQLVVRNDIVHRLRRQDRLQSDNSGKDAEGKPSPTAILGSEETDWFDYTHVEAAAISLSVFLPFTSAAYLKDNKTALPSPPAVLRQILLAETPFAMIVERSLLGTCFPEKPPYKFRISSSSVVQLSWSRSSLSVLATSCTTLKDFASTVREMLMQRGSARRTSAEQHGAVSTETFHVDVVPHLTRKAYWRRTGQGANDDSLLTELAGDDLSNPNFFYKQMHPFSASRLTARTGTATRAAKRRVDVRKGVCVLYHPERLSYPAEYYSLQRGCARVRRTETKNPVDNSNVYVVHLYIMQGGADHEQVLTDAYEKAERLLLDAVGVPPALLQNAVWLESAVNTWIDIKTQEREGNTREHNSGGCTSASCDVPTVEKVGKALELVRKRTHLVPCLHVAFQCANVEEAQHLEEVLLRCCVAPSTPPLGLTPAVQLRYKSVVVAPQLRKQPLWSVLLDIPSLQMTCEGREPTTCCDELPSSKLNTEKSPQSARRDAVFSFTPFKLCYDRFAEKQCFKLTVFQKTEMYVCSPSSTDSMNSTNSLQGASTKQTLLEVAPRAAPSSPQSSPNSSRKTSASLLLRFVMYHRPPPHPSLKRYGVYVDPTSTMKVRVGPAMLEWAEAWWDSVGLLTNRLFGEEVIVGYPWWSPSVAEPFKQSRDAETAWCSNEDYGGNTMGTMLDLVAAAVEVEMVLPRQAAATSSEEPPLCAPDESNALRFAARDISLQWRLTEALNRVQINMKSPFMQLWCPFLSSDTASSAGWVTVIAPQAFTEVFGSPTSSGNAGLSVDWKLHKLPPMLSTSDWICNTRDGSCNGVTAGNAKEGKAHTPIGFRDRQEMELALSCVTLLYSHPLLMKLIDSFIDGVLPRAITVVNREPCWFHDGVLYSPPLTWPHHGVPSSTEIAWSRLRKSVLLRRVVLHLPNDLKWMETGSSGLSSLACASEMVLESLTYSDCLHAKPAATALVASSAASSPSPNNPDDNAVPVTTVQNSRWLSVEQTHALTFHKMFLRRHDASAALSSDFAALFPSWTFTLTFPVFQTASVWKEKEEWPKTFHVHLHSVNADGRDAQQQTRNRAMWSGTTADLAFAMKLMHANYVAGNSAHIPSTDSPTQSKQTQQTRRASAATNGESQVDMSPASLLKPVVETSAWVLDVESCFEARIALVDSQSSCSVELGGAHAVLYRGLAGEVSCTLEARQFSIGYGTQTRNQKAGALHRSKNNDSLPLFSFPVASSALSHSSTVPLLRIQYGWQWLAKTSTRRTLYTTLHATHGVTITLDGLGLENVQSILQCLVLRASLSPYISAASAETANGWEKIAVKLELAQLDCQVPCVLSHERESTSASSQRDLRLCASISGVLIKLRKEAETWKGLVHAGHFTHCVLCDHHETAAALTMPLLLEQPVGWTQPVASSQSKSWRSQSPLPTQRRAQTTDVPKPAQQSVLDELFGELPSMQVCTVPPSGMSVVNGQPPPALPPASPTSLPSQMQKLSQFTVGEPDAENFFALDFTHTSTKSSVTTTLKPFWLLMPSVVHTSQLILGLSAQLRSIGAVFPQPSLADSSLPSLVTAAVERSYAADVRVGAVTVFVLQEMVALSSPDCTAQQIEDAIKNAFVSEVLLMATEAAIVQWDSDAAEASPSNYQTVLQLRNTSICALRGIHQCNVILERFSISITRELELTSGNAALEEWKLLLDPLQLTLTHIYYAALLRVAFQQTSLLAALMSSASTASYTLATAAAIAEESREGMDGRNITGAACPPQQQQAEAPLSDKRRILRSYRFQLASLDLRLEEDREEKGAVVHLEAVTAVYVRLKQLDATYYSGQLSASVVEQKGIEATNAPLRFAVSLQSCFLGKEDAIPTISLTTLTASTQGDNASVATTPSCELRITENIATKAKSGVAHVRQLIITVEAIPVVTWIHLLYAPYLQLAVPNYQTAKELFMQRDLWLTEDLVLTERAPLRAVNKSYSLLHLYGNGHTIYLNASWQGKLILLDEGITLRITRAIICMEGESIEAYVSAGNGSYVVLNRETCTVVRPADAAAAAASQNAIDDARFSSKKLEKLSKATPQQMPLLFSQQTSTSPKWAEFEGDVQVQLRVPEPRTTFAPSSVLPEQSVGTSTAHFAAAEAQRTLVLHSDMQLSLVNAASAVSGASEISGSFVLAHASVRTEFVTSQGTTVDTSDLISDWAMTVQYTEEKRLSEKKRDDVGADNHVSGSSGARQQPSAMRRVQHLRNVRLDASSGVELRLHYSDVFFVLRAARHAQATFTKWKDAMQRDLWSGLLTLPRGWDVEEVEGSRVKESLVQDRSSATASSFASTAPSTCVVTKTSFDLQIPYMCFFAVDDSQYTDAPLFCLYVNEIRTLNFAVESPHVKAEIQFTLQLDYYGLAKSQWAPVLDPLNVNLALNWRRNRSILDVYNRQGFLRVAVQTSSIKLCATLELLRNVRQLQLLRTKFEEAGLELFKPTSTVAVEKGDTAATTEEPPFALSSSFHAFNLLQTTGVEIVACLPQYVPNALHYSDDNSNSSSSHVLASGGSWAFNLPRTQGKELPREQQKIVLQHHIRRPQHHTAGDQSRGAVVSVASVGVQRVPLSVSGPLRRYVLADVSIRPQQEGQKQIHLHSIILFHNKISSDVLQLALNEHGTYDAVGDVPAGTARHVSVGVLRRRVCLALSKSTTATAASKQRQSYALCPDSLVALGVSYDSLPCLANYTFLCVSSPIVDNDVAKGRTAPQQTRLAKGKNFDIYSGKVGKSYFMLRVLPAARQPSDVRRYPVLAPLRATTVIVEAAVMIHNAVGLPLTLTLLTRRVRPGMQLSLLDNAPDTAVYTARHTTTLKANASYGATEMDPLDDVCVGVALQQPNGNTLLQWSSQVSENRTGATGNNIDTAYYPPACIYCPGDPARRDGQIVLADPTTGATLVLYIKYTARLVTFYCPYWIVNETQFPLQFADTSLPHANVTDRCANPIAGLGGRIVPRATVAAWGESRKMLQKNQPSPPHGSDESTANSEVYLYNSLRAESCSKNKNNAGTNGLFVRVWEDAAPDSNEPAGFSDWSYQALSIHEADEVQVITCTSRRTRGALLVVSCGIQLGSQTSLHAYSDTHVIYIRPRWVLVNKSPYTLCFSQSQSSGRRRDEKDAAFIRVGAFSEAVVSSLATAATIRQGGRLDPFLSFAIADDAQHNVQQCHWSPSLSINIVHENSMNLVYHSLTPLREYWPQSSAEKSESGQAAAQNIPDSLPNLHPEDIKEVNGELFVDREETKVFTTMVYAYKGCMMCVEIEEASQPPIIVENRTLYRVCFRQRGVQRVSTVFPRCRKAWTWDAEPSGPSTPATVELWLAQEQDESIGAGRIKAGTLYGRGLPITTVSPRTSCVLNFNPQQVAQHSRNANGFQQEIELEDPVQKTSTMLFLRVRGVNGMSYAVSITTEPTIDAYRTLPYPQLAFALHVENMFALLSGEDGQNVLLCAIAPLSFTFSQGIRRRRDGANPSQTTAADVEDADTDVQRLQLRFSTFQVDDERPTARERVVVQLVDDRESGFQIERKLLRTTPILYCSVVAFRLTPVELHVEDGFVTAMMGYQELLYSSWDLAWPTGSTATRRAALTTAAEISFPPWKTDLDSALARTRHAYTELEGDGNNSGGGFVGHGPHSRHASTHLWSRFVAIEQLYVDPVLVSLSLYRSLGAADDPLWKIAGAASLLVGSTRDARLQWDAVQRHHLCDTIWHLFFVHRESYRDQMKKQYMSLVNVMGLGTMRNFVSGLLSDFVDAPRNQRDGGGNGAAVRRQKPRVPLRRDAKFCIDQPPSERVRGNRRDSSAAVHYGDRAISASSLDAETNTESIDVTTAFLQQVKDRQVPVNAQRAVTLSEVAQSYPWKTFISVAQAPELRAFGGLALARSIASMAATSRYTQTPNEGHGGRKMSAQEVVVNVNTSASMPRVQCTRCVELEALRLQRMQDGAATPLPHPIRDGFLTWEEFAHHINWYEFIDMCSDDEVCKYASLVRAGAYEASSNACTITLI